MPIHVKVVSADDYSKWVDGKKKEIAAKADDPSKVWELAALSARGEKLYAANCAVCHRPDGKGAGPIKALDGSAIVLDADKAKQIDVLLNGRLNGAMPAWKSLSDTDLAAVITYTKNNWSNKTGQLVQPADVQAVRAGKTLAAALEKLKARADAKVALSGYVDATGNAAQNAELAKQRAVAVRDALTAGGVAADRIELRKPGQITAGQVDKNAARRVEIVSAG